VPAPDAIIATPRLLLRNFIESDLDEMVDLMANPDFMRFSTGVFTREKTASFLFDRVIAPAQAGQPSLFAVILREENRLIGYCGFLRQIVDEIEEIEIGYRLHPITGIAVWRQRRPGQCTITLFPFSNSSG
jgi:RimJ/RimL family protein N-acetyltransferase